MHATPSYTLHIHHAYTPHTAQVPTHAMLAIAQRSITVHVNVSAAAVLLS